MKKFDKFEDSPYYIRAYNQAKMAKNLSEDFSPLAGKEYIESLSEDDARRTQAVLLLLKYKSDQEVRQELEAADARS